MVWVIAFGELFFGDLWCVVWGYGGMRTHFSLLNPKQSLNIRAKGQNSCLSPTRPGWLLRGWAVGVSGLFSIPPLMAKFRGLVDGVGDLSMVFRHLCARYWLGLSHVDEVFTYGHAPAHR